MKTKGASLVEYGIVVGLIGVVTVGAVLGTGTEVRNAFNETASTIGLAQYIPDGAVSTPPVVEEEEADICDTTTTPGTVCPDGTVFAGDISFGRMFVSPCDADMEWNGSACGGSRAMLAWNGSANGNWMVNAGGGVGRSANDALTAIDADPTAPGKQIFAAAQYCGDASAHGYSDWFLPATSAMNMMSRHWSAIGGFADGEAYWTIYESTTSQAFVQRIGTNAQLYGSGKHRERPVRCARIRPYVE